MTMEHSRGEILGRRPGGSAAVTERKPQRKPAITLEAIKAADEHFIAAGAYWFARGTRRLDRLLRQFGYARISPVAVEHAPDEEWSVALVQAVDLDADGEEPVTVAVLGRSFFLELYGRPTVEGPESLTMTEGEP